MPILTLFRPRLSAVAALSALAGYALHPSPHAPATSAALLTAVFLLVAGCSALNQVQERRLDARMERTRCRPIASGRFSPRAGLACALLPMLLALALLWHLRPAAALLGLGAAAWYNGAYTPLKRRTAFALLPGALCGALPPLIGWVAAGGNPGDYRIVLAAGLLFLWQIPHFWFFALKHRDDFQQAGLPTLLSTLPAEQLHRLALLWVFALACATLLPLTFGLLHHPVARLLGGAASAGLAGCAALRLIGDRESHQHGASFVRLNLALLLILSALLTEGFY